MRYIALLFLFSLTCYSQDSMRTQSPVMMVHTPNYRRGQLLDTLYGINGEIISPRAATEGMSVGDFTDSVNAHIPRTSVITINGVLGDTFTISDTSASAYWTQSGTFLPLATAASLYLRQDSAKLAYVMQGALTTQLGSYLPTATAASTYATLVIANRIDNPDSVTINGAKGSSFTLPTITVTDRIDNADSVTINGTKGQTFTISVIGSDDSVRLTPAQKAVVIKAQDSTLVITGTNADQQGAKRIWASYQRTAANTIGAVGRIAPTQSGTVADTLDPALVTIGMGVKYTNTVTKMSTAGIVSTTANELAAAWKFDVSFVIKTSCCITRCDSAGYSIGLYANTTSSDTVSPFLGMCEFRYMNGWDTGKQWRCFTQKAPYQKDSSITDVVIAPNTKFILRITSTGSAINYYINDVLKVTHNTAANIPTTMLGIGAKVVNRRLGWGTNPTAPNGTTEMKLSHVYISHD